MPINEEHLLKKIKTRSLKISVLGLGYIGLPTAVVFANAGFDVYGFDVNPNVLEKLNSGRIHFHEPNLQKEFERAIKTSKLHIVNSLAQTDAYIICVPTPIDNKKRANLSFVKEAARMIGNVIRDNSIVILESTVPPSTTEEVVGKIISEESGLTPNKDFILSHCPERVLPGNILNELRNNHRIVGASDKKLGEIVKTLYEQILESGEVTVTEIKTAELCKLVENAYRDLNIAFANELSIISDKIGIDVFELIELANKHPRVNILKPGPGVGGHCIPVDPWFIIQTFPEDTRLIKVAREVNDYKINWVIDKVLKFLSRIDKPKSKIIVGILGMSYKSDVDDLRESPSLKIAGILKDKGYNVLACEPYVHEEKILDIPNLSLYEILKKSDYIVISVAHRHFLEEKEKIKKYAHKICDCVGLLR